MKPFLLRIKLFIKKILPAISIFSLALAVFSIWYSGEIPEFKHRENSYCYLHDAMIVTIKCGDSVSSFFLNFFNPLISFVLMIGIVTIPIIILVDYLILRGIWELIKLTNIRFSNKESNSVKLHE